MHHIYGSGQDIPNGIKQAHCAHKTLSNTAQAAPLHAHCRKHMTKRQDEGRPHPRTCTHAHCKIGIACLQSVLVRACDTQQAMLDFSQLAAPGASLHFDPVQGQVSQPFTRILPGYIQLHRSCIHSRFVQAELRWAAAKPAQAKPQQRNKHIWYSVKAAAARGHLFRMPW